MVWPPGFYAHGMKDDVFVRNGGGSSIGQIGDGVWLRWGSQEAADYSDECPGANFLGIRRFRSSRQPDLIAVTRCQG